ncbi:hypothetical protein CGRA01v4_15039 [Colletotrichum graminicola]|nr:hypothetical protein CGRA01v4_15039 [Colletotrichum graminicola]
MANNNNNNNGNQSGANQGRLAASRAIASLYASVEGHGRHLHAQLRENPDVAAKDIRAERANATLQDRWEPHPWVPVAYAPRPPIAPLIIRKMAWITDKVLSRPGATVDDLAALWAGSPRDPENAGLLLRTLVTSGASNLTKTLPMPRLRGSSACARMLALHEAEVEEADEEAEMLRLVQNAEEQLRQQQEEEEEEGEEETEGSRRYNEAFIMHSGNQDNDDNDSFFGYDADGPNNDEPARPQTSPLISHPFPGPNSNEDPFGVSPCAPVAVRPRPESDSESDAPPRQRRRTATTVSSESESEPEAVPDSNASSSPAPAPASRARRVRRARRPRPPAADQQEEIERIAESIYRSTMSQLRQGTFTRRMPLADRRDIAWRARAGVLDAAAVQDEGIVEPNNEPRAGQTFEDYLDSEDDEEMLA